MCISCHVQNVETSNINKKSNSVGDGTAAKTSFSSSSLATKKSSVSQTSYKQLKRELSVEEAFFRVQRRMGGCSYHSIRPIQRKLRTFCSTKLRESMQYTCVSRVLVHFYILLPAEIYFFRQQVAVQYGNCRTCAEVAEIGKQVYLQYCTKQARLA